MSSINTILFDLDATLLQMDQDEFVKEYFVEITKKCAKSGYDPKQLISVLWGGTEAMVNNDGSETNESRFNNFIKSVYKEKTSDLIEKFYDFYEEEFVSVKRVVKDVTLSDKIVKQLKNKGYKLILATNPVFPKVATYERIRWAGLDFNDFDLITTYENSCYCKPNPKYYVEILEKIDKKPEEVMMVGNDVSEDMVAGSVGLDTYLITNYLINKEGIDISIYKNGTINQFLKFALEKL